MSTSVTQSGGYLIKNSHSITITTTQAEDTEPFDILQMIILVLQTMRAEPLEREGLRTLLESLKSEI
jgi:hypothetical protein